MTPNNTQETTRERFDELMDRLVIEGIYGEEWDQFKGKEEAITVLWDFIEAECLRSTSGLMENLMEMTRTHVGATRSEMVRHFLTRCGRELGVVPVLVKKVPPVDDRSMSEKMMGNQNARKYPSTPKTK